MEEDHLAGAVLFEKQGLARIVGEVAEISAGVFGDAEIKVQLRQLAIVSSTATGVSTYRTISLPSHVDILNIKLGKQLIRKPMPDPVLVKLALILILQQQAIHVLLVVAGAVGSALNLILRLGPSHADVDGRVNLVAHVLAALPELGRQTAHVVVADVDGLGVDEDAHRRQVDGESRLGRLG